MKFLVVSVPLLVLVVLTVFGGQVAFDIHSNEGEKENKTLAARYGEISNDSLLWAPYRSQLYFGVRPRIPRSLLSGLMWFSMDSYDGVGKIRHFYEQGDDMKKANWESYDPRFGGREVIEDSETHFDIVIDFVKSSDGKSWGVKVKGKPHAGYENLKISFVWYSGLEGGDLANAAADFLDEENKLQGILKLENKRNYLGYTENVKLTGASETLGWFELEIGDGPSSNKHPAALNRRDPELNPGRAHHYSLRVPDDNVWRARDIFMTMLIESVNLLNEMQPGSNEFPPEQAYIIKDLQNFAGNLHFVQKVYEGPCEFDIIFNNALTPEEDKVSFENINHKIEQTHKAVNEKFRGAFTLQAPFNDKKYETFAKEILSGLLGGLSYSYGDHLVDRKTVFDEDSFISYTLSGELEGPFELFTFVPSRPFFPRGFYWDEGFHLLPLLNYDSDLVLEVLKSWFNLIDDEGWIAREQILGPELRSRVPEEFQVQSPQIVNPPTLMLVFVQLLESVQHASFGSIDTPELETKFGDFESDIGNQLGLVIMNNPSLLVDYAKHIYPKLKSHFEMFRKTQRGYVEEFDRGTNLEAYRWRGRTVTHCLASGIDDYPRALPADIAELNVDLLSWMGVMAKSMKSIAQLIENEKDYIYYQDIEADISANIENLHWSETEQSYCDVSVDDNDVNIHVCHKGYVTLFPFITKLIPAQKVDRLQPIIDSLTNPDELWSSFGIRSLAKNDEFYRTNENYWRSPVWININSLVLDALVHYKDVSGPYMSKSLAAKFSETYIQLRSNIVNNIYKNWQDTGFVWEQYDDQLGQGQGAKNFLGWTSAVLTMMNMPQSI